MSRKGSHIHRASDAHSFGQMDYYHILPMTEKKRLEIRDEQNLVTLIGRKKIANPGYRKRLIRRALALEAKHNIRTQAENNGPDKWHVLVESKTGKKIKMAAMSRAESFRRNASIRDLGMAWTLGTM